MNSTIKIFNLPLLVLALGFISGCGNADLESAVYRSYNGRIECEDCYRENLRNKNPGAIVSSGTAWGLYHATTEGDKAHALARKWDIKTISSSRTSMKDVWLVTIKGDCPIHGSQFIQSEYSYKGGKAKFIKSIK